MPKRAFVASFPVLLLIARLTLAQDRPGASALLPPEIPWNGQSRALALPPNDKWATPAERESLLRTPSYEETVAWLRTLVAAAPELRMESIGTSPEGREIVMVIASREKAFTAEALKAGGKPTVLAHAGIHAGEIDGKDAGLMLLRDMTVRGTCRALLDAANFLFIPILNVDGHERATPFARINQRGPEAAGWRTTARNLNLNRDFTKLDAPETRALVAALNRFDPDLYLDLHVTDGNDHQYDVMFGHNEGTGWSPRLDEWLTRELRPAVTRDLTAAGHIPGPLWAAFPVDPADLGRGFTSAPGGARFSTGYGDVRHLATLLLETHSLKPYPQRVLGSYVFLEAVLRVVGARAASLRAATAQDRESRAAVVPLDFAADPNARQTAEYRGIEARSERSPVSGGWRLVYTGRPLTRTVPVHVFRATAKATRPLAYWVPAAWPEVIERLRLHGLRMETMGAPREMEVEMHRLLNPTLASAPFEGRVPLTSETAAEPRRERFAKGSVRVPTDQPGGDLAVVLLDPASPDSFLRWGFFLEVLQATEYVEDYVMEPMAERMLAADPALRTEMERRIREDPSLATPQGRLLWMYRRTPFADDRWRLYPVGIERAPAN